MAFFRWRVSALARNIDVVASGHAAACVGQVLTMRDQADIVVIGAGAAGLFASIWAGRTIRAGGLDRAGASVVAVDGAKKLGAKVLVAGGGRCNVTHHAVDETAYAGASRNAIRKVLRGFGVR